MATQTLQTKFKGIISDAESSSSEKRLQGLSNLGRLLTENVELDGLVIGNPQVFGALVRAGQDETRPAIRKLGILCLSQIIRVKMDAAVLDKYAIVDTLVRAANGSDDDLKRAAVKGLIDLASQRDCRTKVCLSKGTLDIIFRLADNGDDNDEMKLRAVFLLLKFIADDEENHDAVISRHEFVDIVLKGIRSKNTGLSEIMIRAIYHIAAGKAANTQRVFDIKGLLEALVHVVANSKSNSCVNLALNIFIRFSYFSMKMAREMALVEGLIQTVMNHAKISNSTADAGGDGDEVRHSAMVVLWNVTEVVAVAEQLMDEHDFLSYVNALSFQDDSIIAILYLNLATAPRARTELRHDLKAIERLEKLGHMEDMKGRYASKLAMAILRGSEGGDANQLRTDGETFKDILEILRTASEGTRLFENFWPVNQPLLALRYLTILDSNRAALGTKWLLMLPKSVLKGIDKDDPTVIESALACLSQYALDPLTLPVLQKDAEIFVQSAQHVIDLKAKEEAWTGAVNAASGFIFTLKGKDKTRTMKPAHVKDKQLMISYAWGPPPHKNQTIAAEVEVVLEEHGFSVWRDVNMLREDIMSAMAEGVSSSSAVIVLVSKTYMESANCRRELTYALNLKKKIVPLCVEPGYDYRVDGWLGVCIGSLLGYDICSSPARREVLQGMITKEFKFGSTQTVTSRPTQRQPSLRAARIFTSEADVRQWAEDVRLPNGITEMLIKHGYTTTELLESLSNESTPDLAKLLQFEIASYASRLRAELRKLFPS